MRINLMILVLLAACGGSDAKRLEKARALWLEAGSDTYDMTVQRVCFCPDNDPVRAQVVGGGVRAATKESPGGDVILEQANFESWFTVSGLFDEIEAGLDAGAHEVLVEYDELTGYPISIDIDFEQLAADDELSFAVLQMALNPDG